MATINIDDVLQLVATWDTPLASVAQNVWHLIMTGGAGVDSAVVIDAIEAQQQAAMLFIDDHISDEFAVTLMELRRWDFTLNRFDGVEVLATTLIAGVSALDYMPHGVAALGRVITAAARRQGGTFIPGLIDTSVLDGVLTAGAETQMALYLAAFDNDIVVTGGTLEWCTFNVDPLSPVFETASIASGSVIANSLPSYLGKRKPGVGL